MVNVDAVQVTHERTKRRILDRLEVFMQRPSSQTTLLLFASIYPLNTLQVCIWWPCFLHARNITPVDNVKDRRQATFDRIQRLVCVEYETHSQDVSHGDLRT